MDDTTTVRLSNDLHIVISQGDRLGYTTSHIIVRDVDALTRALTQAQLVQAEREAMADDSALIDATTRSALFAALSEVYPGISKDRTRRLAKLNLLAGRSEGRPHHQPERSLLRHDQRRRPARVRHA